MQAPGIPRFIEDLCIARQYRLLDDEYGRGLEHAFRKGVVVDDDRDELSRRVSTHQINQALEGPFRTPRHTQGEIVQGLDVQKRFIRMKLEWMLAPTLTLGATGAGKSIAALFRALGLAFFTSNLWLVDSGLKQEWRRIRPLLERMGIELLTVHGQSAKLAPFQVPHGVSPLTWINCISDLFVHVLSLPRRATQLLQTIVHRLYVKWNVYDRNECYPSVLDVLQAIRDDRASNPQARSALIDGLESLVAGTQPAVFSYRKGWPIHKLAKLPINWVFNDLSANARDIFVASLVLAELTSAVAEGKSNVTRPRVLISIDEATPLLRRSGATHNPLLALLAQARGLGIVFDLAISTSVGIAPEVVSCAGTRYIGRVNSATDLDLLGKSMGLKGRQYEYAFQRLQTGEFICQCGAANNDLRAPYLVKIPRMTFPQDLGSTDDHFGVLSTWKVEREDGINRPSGNIGNAEVGQQGGVFDDEREYLFCKCVGSNPMKPSSWYPRQIKVSTKTAQKIRKVLLERGYLRAHEVQQHSRGRASILLELTAKGVAALETVE